MGWYGKPKDFLLGVELFLNDLYEKKHHELFTPICDSVGKNVFIDKSAKVEEGCFIGPNAVKKIHI